MPVGLDRVKASFQTGVSQATWVSDSRDKEYGKVPNHITPSDPRSSSGPLGNKGKQQQKRELLFLPLQPELRMLGTQGPDLMTVAKLLWA